MDALRSVVTERQFLKSSGSVPRFERRWTERVEGRPSAVFLTVNADTAPGASRISIVKWSGISQLAFWMTIQSDLTTACEEKGTP